MNNDRTFVSFTDQKCCTINTIQELFPVNLYFRLIITGKHLINSEIFAFNQSGYHHGMIKFKYNMIFAEENAYLIVNLSRQNFTDFCILENLITSGFSVSIPWKRISFKKENSLFVNDMTDFNVDDILQRVMKDTKRLCVDAKLWENDS